MRNDPGNSFSAGFTCFENIPAGQYKRITEVQ